MTQVIEKGFEKEPTSQNGFLDASAEYAKHVLDEFTNDRIAYVEAYARNMVKQVHALLRDSSLTYSPYFVLEESLHEEIHESFTQKLGLPSKIDTNQKILGTEKIDNDSLDNNIIVVHFEYDQLLVERAILLNADENQQPYAYGVSYHFYSPNNSSQ